MILRIDDPVAGDYRVFLDGVELPPEQWILANEESGYVVCGAARWPPFAGRRTWQQWGRVEIVAITRVQPQEISWDLAQSLEYPPLD